MAVKKPHLVIASETFLPRWDGISRVLAEIIPHLTEKFRVTVVAPEWGKMAHKGYSFVGLPLKPKEVDGFRLAKWRYGKVKRVVREADVVFVQSIGPVGFAALHSAARLGKPVAAYLHNVETQLVPMAIGANPLRKFLYPLMRWYTKWIYNKADLLLAPSEWMVDQLSWTGIRSRKLVVPLGVDIKKFVPGRDEQLRASLGIAPDDIVVGQHGRLAHEKDIKTLLRGFVRARHKQHNLKLLVVADGLPELRRLLQKQDGVICPGGQDDVVPYVQCMDIFVVSSLVETTCLAALEAMSCGLPIISTPVGFVKDYVKEGENGFLFPFRDSHQLSRKIDFLARHPTLRARMGSNARAMVVKEFSWEKTAEQLVEHLQGLLEEKRS